MIAHIDPLYLLMGFVIICIVCIMKVSEVIETYFKQKWPKPSAPDLMITEDPETKVKIWNAYYDAFAKMNRDLNNDKQSDTNRR